MKQNLCVLIMRIRDVGTRNTASQSTDNITEGDLEADIGTTYFVPVISTHRAILLEINTQNFFTLGTDFNYLHSFGFFPILHFNIIEAFYFRRVESLASQVFLQETQRETMKIVKPYPMRELSL